MSRRTRRDGTWTNWAGNQRARPVRVARPADEAEIVRTVADAAARKLAVKVVGAGHSFTDIAATDGILVDLDRHRSVRSIDHDRRLVTVDAGIRLRDLNGELARAGLALPNLGDIVEQSVAGAISTGTHGTGLGYQGIASAVVGMRLVTGDGSVVECSAEQHPEILHVARVGLGALGVVSTVTLQCVERFALHAVEEPLPLDEVLDRFDSWATEHDHTEFFWFPYTDVALTKRNDRTDAAPTERPRWKQVVDEEIMQNGAFGAINRLGRARPAWIPGLARMAARTMGRSEYVARSDQVFATPRRVRFTEMEYAIPRRHVVEAVRRVRDLIPTLHVPISFPIEVRVLGADDIPLSTATERESAYLAVHVYRGMANEQYFRGVEAIADDYDGRPHWGKLHFQNAATLAPRYPQRDRFRDVRAELDPDGRFANAYLDRVLGPVGG